MSPILVGTFGLLSSWGRWGQGAYLGLPRRAAFFGERALKTPLYCEENPDPGVMIVDSVVCRLEAEEKSIIIRKFQHKWQTRQFMREYHWSFRRYHVELERAVWAVHVGIEGLASE